MPSFIVVDFLVSELAGGGRGGQDVNPSVLDITKKTIVV